MATQKSLDEVYMNCARDVSALSHAKRKKVGAIIVNDGGIIGEGWNGTPSGFDNACELPEYHTLTNKGNLMRGEFEHEWYCEKCNKTYSHPQEHETILITKPEVIHAEANAIAKVARSTNRTVGATLYCTLSPCFECAKQIIQAGIKRVVFLERYPYAGHNGPVRLLGLELLYQAKIQVELYENVV